MKRVLLLATCAAGLPTSVAAQGFSHQHYSAHFCKPNQIGGQASVSGEYQNQGSLLALDNMVLTSPIVAVTASSSAAAQIEVVYDSSAVTAANPIACGLSRIGISRTEVGDEVAGFPATAFNFIILDISDNNDHDGIALNVEFRVVKGIKILAYDVRQ